MYHSLFTENEIEKEIQTNTETQLEVIQKEFFPHHNYHDTIAVDGFLYQLQLTSTSFLWNLRYLQLRNGTLVSFKPVCLLIYNSYFV